MGRPEIPIEQRLEANKSVDSNSCWNWLGFKDKDGYGTVWFDGKMRRVSRVMASLNLGLQLDSEVLVCHHCDNPACFNPEHLYLGNAKQNMTDMHSRGRASGCFVNGPTNPYNSTKTHCPKGHEYTPENTLLRRGKRECRECTNSRRRVVVDKRRKRA